MSSQDTLTAALRSEPFDLLKPFLRIYFGYPQDELRLAELLSDLTDLDELADYVLKLSDIVLGAKNARLAFCILAQIRHEGAAKMATTLYRSLKMKEDNGW